MSRRSNSRDIYDAMERERQRREDERGGPGAGPRSELQAQLEVEQRARLVEAREEQAQWQARRDKEARRLAGQAVMEQAALDLATAQHDGDVVKTAAIEAFIERKLREADDA